MARGDPKKAKLRDPPPAAAPEGDRADEDDVAAAVVSPRGADGGGTSTSGEAAQAGCSVAGRRDTAPFLLKTWDLVNNPDTNDTIGWSAEGRTFVVRKPDEFSKKVLPTAFKHSNYSSFVRQLNIYGFKKVAGQRNEFVHPCFVRGDKGQLGQISRSSQVTAAPTTDQSLRTENMWLKQQVYQTWAYYELVMQQLEGWGLSREVLAQKMGVPRLPRYDVSPSLVLGKPVAPSGAQLRPAQEQEQEEAGDEEEEDGEGEEEQEQEHSRQLSEQEQRDRVVAGQQLQTSLNQRQATVGVDEAQEMRQADFQAQARNLSSQWMTQIQTQWQQQQKKLEEQAARVRQQTSQPLLGVAAPPLPGQQAAVSIGLGLIPGAGLKLPMHQQPAYPPVSAAFTPASQRLAAYPRLQQSQGEDTASPPSGIVQHALPGARTGSLGTPGSAFVRPEILKKARLAVADATQPVRSAGVDWASRAAGHRSSDQGAVRDVEGLAGPHRPAKARRLHMVQGAGGGIHVPVPIRYGSLTGQPSESLEDCSPPPPSKQVLLFGVPLGRKGKV